MKSIITVNNKKHFITLSLIIVIIISCALAYQTLFNKCFWWNCAPIRKFNTDELNLPHDFFPITSRIIDLHEIRNDTSTTYSSTSSINWNNGLAIYTIRKFPTVSKSKDQYGFEKEFRFTKSDSHDISFPQIEDFDSKYSDQSNIQCGFVQRDLRCVFIGRYQEFLVFFSGSLGNDEMSEQDFIGVINYIDENMKALLME